MITYLLIQDYNYPQRWSDTIFIHCPGDLCDWQPQCSTGILPVCGHHDQLNWSTRTAIEPCASVGVDTGLVKYIIVFCFPGFLDL